MRRQCVWASDASASPTHTRAALLGGARLGAGPSGSDSGAVTGGGAIERPGPRPEASGDVRARGALRARELRALSAKQGPLGVISVPPN